MSVSVVLRWVVVLLGVAQLQGESFWDVSDVIPPKEALAIGEEVPPPSWRACGFQDAAAVVDRVMNPGGPAKVRGARLEERAHPHSPSTLSDSCLSVFLVY